MRVCNIIRVLTLMAGLALILAQASAQDSSIRSATPFQVEAFVEAYLSYDFSKPEDHQRPPFLYNHSRAGEVNINLAYLKGSYNTNRVRMNLALAAGTYMNANYAAEPATLQFLFEANAGIRLAKKKKLWLDMGILPSHLGFESAVSLDNWTPGRSLVAENSPYFETGIRLGYENDPGTWNFNLLALNGWQTITRVPGNSMVSWGAQVQYKPSATWLFNYGNFIGTVYPDSTRRIRHYHNFYARYQRGRFGLIGGFDIGQEEKSPGDDAWNTWFTPVVIAQFRPSDAWAFALRGEYFSDPANIVIIQQGPGDFKATGLSFNADFFPIPNAALRMEYRWLHGRDAVFEKNNVWVKDNHALLFSLAVRF
jgi:Putative beta-barrel porin-2, OmpL-like. bbp2